MYIRKSTILTKQPWKILYRKRGYEPSGWSMFIRCSFDEKENKLDYYREKEFIEKLCKKIKESVNEIINRKKKRNDTITWWRS